MFVCLCKGVTDRTIRAEIQRGACSPEQIAACTGAGTKCGRCREEVAELVEREVVQQAFLRGALGSMPTGQGDAAPSEALESARRSLPMVAEADAA